MARSVLHVIPAVAPRYGGPSAAVLGLCGGLQAAGTEVTIATTDADGLGRLNVPLGTVGTHAGVPAIFFPRRGGDSFKWSRPLAHWLREHVQTFDIVHIHAVFSHSTIAAGRACLRVGVPYIVRPLGTMDPWSLGRHAWRKHILWHVGLGRVMRNAVAMHYTTAAEQRLAERTTGLPPGFVVPLGLDPAWFDESNAPPRQPQILILARLDRKKGIETAIAAFHRLATDWRWTKWSLVIAGSGDRGYTESLREKAQAGPGRDRIAFVGWLEDAARVHCVRQSSLFVLPSHQENFGIAVAEAMATGTPVIVSPDVNLAADIAAAEAGWVVARDPEALSLVLAGAMGDDTERARRGERARRAAEKYRWATVCGAISQVYTDLTAQARH